jgi:1,4-alpha-glucan branching enzyme
MVPERRGAVMNKWRTVMTIRDKTPGEKDGPSAAHELEDLIAARESDPFRLLGPHWIDRDGEKALAVRSLRPDARELSIVWGQGAPQASFAAVRIDPAGLFEAIIPASVLNLSGHEAIVPTAYRLRFGFPDGAVYETYDAFAFPPILTEYDLYLFGEGTQYWN